MERTNPELLQWKYYEANYMALDEEGAYYVPCPNPSDDLHRIFDVTFSEEIDITNLEDGSVTSHSFSEKCEDYSSCPSCEHHGSDVSETG